MSRGPIPTWFFVLVAVRQGERWLLVREAKHNQRWYMPAGRVEPGESMLAAAKRETLEEAGIPIEIEGIARVEHSPRADGTARVRAVLLARPTVETPPKQTADEHSIEARWFTLREMEDLPLRGLEVLDILAHLSGNPSVASPHFITEEGAAYR